MSDNDSSIVEDDHQPLAALWRLPSHESFSDWTLTILHRADPTSCVLDCDIYHVHKAFLSLLPNKCGYFESIMKRGDCYRESSEESSEIELHPFSAKAFPLFLDYLYTGKTNIDHESVVPLRSLARYFDCPKLERLCAVFVPELEHIRALYEQTRLLRDDDYDVALGKGLSKVMEATLNFHFPTKIAGYPRTVILAMLEHAEPPTNPLRDDGDEFYGRYNRRTNRLVQMDVQKPTEWSEYSQECENFLLNFKAALSLYCDDDDEMKRQLFDQMTSRESLSSIGCCCFALHLLVFESRLTEEGLGCESMTAHQEKCLEVFFQSTPKFVIANQHLFLELLQRPHAPEFGRRLYDIVVQDLLPPSRKKTESEEEFIALLESKVDRSTDDEDDASQAS